MLIFHYAAEIDQPKFTAEWEIARMDQELQFALRKTSRSEIITWYKAE